MLLIAAVAVLATAGLAANRTPDGTAVPGDDAPVLVPPQAAAGWEYKALPRTEIVEMAPGRKGEFIMPKDVLDDLNRGLEVPGSQGWELVSVEPYHKESYVVWPALYVFRRPK
jgi:hypothetical protein